MGNFSTFPYRRTSKVLPFSLVPQPEIKSRSGIFKSGDPSKRARACVKATTHYTDAKIVADVSRGLGDAMVGINVADIPVPHRLAERGW